MSGEPIRSVFASITLVGGWMLAGVVFGGSAGGIVGTVWIGEVGREGLEAVGYFLLIWGGMVIGLIAGCIAGLDHLVGRQDRERRLDLQERIAKIVNRPRQSVVTRH